jgi:hypothetical protein
MSPVVHGATMAHVSAKAAAGERKLPRQKTNMPDQSETARLYPQWAVPAVFFAGMGSPSTPISKPILYGNQGAPESFRAQ